MDGADEGSTAGRPPGEPADRGGPTPVQRAAPLDGRERRVVALAALAPVAAALVVLIPVGVLVGSSAAEVVLASAVYGGLVGLAAAFVAVDRLQARRCPRCQQRQPRGTSVCGGCGYDLAQRPRFACTERHAVYLDDGLCPCGRRLQPLPVVRGVGPEVRFVLKLGVWLLAFLLGLGLLLQVVERGG